MGAHATTDALHPSPVCAPPHFASPTLAVDRSIDRLRYRAGIPTAAGPSDPKQQQRQSEATSKPTAAAAAAAAPHKNYGTMAKTEDGAAKPSCLWTVGLGVLAATSVVCLVLLAVGSSIGLYNEIKCFGDPSECEDKARHSKRCI